MSAAVNAVRHARRLPSLATRVETTNDKLNYIEAWANAAACRDCAFSHNEAGTLECRAEPPRVISKDGTSTWPLVTPGSWCGRWEAL